MRLLLLIMTGVGFSLGLLCGLLLHLPADGLPTHPHPHPHPIHHHHLHSDRPGRSLSEQEVLTEDLDQKHNSTSNQGDSNMSSSADSRSNIKFSRLHPPSKAGRDPKSVASSSDEANDGHRAAGDRGDSQAGGEGLAGPDRGEIGGVGVKENPHHNPPPPGPAVSQPVTSFRLRLRNAGGQFLVESAVQRHVDDSGREIPGEDRDAPHDSPHQLQDTASPRSVNTTLEDVVRGVLWSSRLEDSCPLGGRVSQHDVTKWRQKAAGLEVVGVEEGCGRMQNRKVTFKDGSQACARYRLNTDQLQGELFSYYLAHLLRFPHHLPPALLLPIHPLAPQWRGVHLQMTLAQWAEGRPVVLTRWMDNLAPAHIPAELRHDDRKLHPTVGILGRKTPQELCDLLQWSDLIVFDYLTANLDRMVNNMFNRQWNPDMMDNPAHNLEKTPEGRLIFLDNESGLFHGYRLLEKYQHYHEVLLQALCVFRGSTATAVKTLHQAGNLGRQLQGLMEQGEVHHRHLPPLPERNMEILQSRLARVYEQIVHCENIYGRGR
ncbi:hypothetical protein ACOMHN_007916 [Nucella lapillus]